MIIMRTLYFISLKMKLNLKTILMSAKTELSSKGKYRLKYKNSVEPPMAATAVKSYLQISFV